MEEREIGLEVTFVVPFDYGDSKKIKTRAKELQEAIHQVIDDLTFEHDWAGTPEIVEMDLVDLEDDDDDEIGLYRRYS